MVGMHRVFCLILLVLVCVLGGPASVLSGEATLAILPLTGQMNQNSGGASSLTVPGSNIPLFRGLAPFLNNNNVQGFDNLHDDIHQRVTSAFFKSRRFRIVERSELAQAMQEAHLQRSVLFDESTAVRLGRLVGARKVLVGSYKASSAYTRPEFVAGNRQMIQDASHSVMLSLNLRLLDVETGRVQDAFEIDANGNSGIPFQAAAMMLNKLSENLEREIGNHYPAQGYVIKIIDKDRLLIDVGTRAGVRQGDKFLIYERGGEMVHPVSGRIIETSKICVGQVVVEFVDQETAIAEVTDREGDIMVGMGIESKPRKKPGFVHNLLQPFKDIFE